MKSLSTIIKRIDELEAAAQLILNNCYRVRQELAQFSELVPDSKKSKGLTKEQALVFRTNFRKRFKTKAS